MTEEGYRLTLRRENPMVSKTEANRLRTLAKIVAQRPRPYDEQDLETLYMLATDAVPRLASTVMALLEKKQDGL